jgi:uncharacterized membrane protein
MSKTRLEAFSDAVIAIIITIMVLEIQPPEGVHLADLRPLAPIVASYTVSFLFLGLWWNNHHHYFQAVERVNGRVLWANLLLLFALSFTPFVTAWMGQSHFAPLPVATYGCAFLVAATAFNILGRALVALHGKDSVIAEAVGQDLKAKISAVIWLAAVPLALVDVRLSLAMYLTVAALWFVPDPRIERRLRADRPGGDLEDPDRDG